MYIPIPMSDEHVSMSSTVRQLLDRHVDMGDVRNVLAMGQDGLGTSEVWRRASEIGLPGVTVPEEYDGMGGSPLDTFVAFRDWGRAVHPSPLLSSVGLAAPAVREAASSAAKAEYLSGIASGELLATLAILEDSKQWEPHDVRTSAVSDGDAYRVTGRKRYVLDVGTADVIFVVARADFGLGLFAVGREGPGVVEEPLTSLDLTRSVSDLTLTDATCKLVSPEEDCTRQLATALAASRLALVADSIGGAEAALDMAVSYAKVREQFGRPVGAFQAVKHKLAELAVLVEGMISAGWHAAEQSEEGSAEAETALLVATIYCAQAYYQVARANIQVHGGIGFTWEHPAHLYFRRALSNSMLLGDTESDRSALYSALVAQHTAGTDQSARADA